MSTDNERPPSCQLKTDRLGPVPPSTVQCRHRSADRTPAGDGFNNCRWRLDRVAAKMHVSCESAVPSTFGSQILQVASALKKESVVCRPHPRRCHCCCHHHRPCSVSVSVLGSVSVLVSVSFSVSVSVCPAVIHFS